MPGIAEPASAIAVEAPRLTVVLVVGSLRGDELINDDGAWRFGLRRLIDGGRIYTQAMHTHGHTDAASGHASLGTGVLPQNHGVVGDVFYQMPKGDRVAVCPSSADSCNADTLTKPTLGDRLKAVSPDSRVVALAHKAAAANLLGGAHADLTVWMQDSNIGLLARTSKSAGVPAWLATLFPQIASPETIGRQWPLPSLPQRFKDIADRAPGERDCGHGLRFPHRIPQSATGTNLVNAWQCTPDSDQALLQTALQTAQHLALGKDDAPDLLYVSLGATARVGEAYGYESLERAATLVALDRALGAFLDVLIEQVGPSVLVVLTSDQGLGAKVPQSRAMGHQAVRLDPKQLTARLEADLGRFGPGPHVAAMLPPFVHLHATDATSRAAKATAAAISLGQVPGIYRAWTPAQLSGDVDPVAQLMAASVYPGRSGDVVVATTPYDGFAAAGPAAEMGAVAGSPWSYDRHVPLVIYGAGISQGHVDEEVAVIDMVRTLGDALGLAPLRSGGGKPLRVPLH